MNPTPAHLTSQVHSLNRTPEGRRLLDLAEGILIGLRRYPPDAAFAELLDVARRHDISAFAAASALVRVASTTTDPWQGNPASMLVAQREWSDLLPLVHAQPDPVVADHWTVTRAQVNALTAAER
jgi:hypothetical protein